MGGTRWRAIMAFALLTVLYLLWSIRYWPFIIDDAYITARYARNMAAGTGPVFNPGEHVMGYTSPLWMGLEAIAYALGADGLWVAKGIGWIAGLVVLALTAMIGKRCGGSEWVGWLAAIWLTIYSPLAVSSVMGLESALFTALFLLAIWLFMEGRNHIVRALVLGGATLARPEGAGFALLFALMEVSQGFRSNDRKMGPSLRWIIWYIGLLLPIAIGLTLYYGSPIPNTFFAKTAAGLSLYKYIAGLIYLLTWFIPFGFYMPLLWVWLSPRDPSWPHLRWLIVSAAFYLAYVVYAGGDWMPGFRFLLPALPLLSLISAAGLIRLIQQRRWFLPCALLLAILVLIPGWIYTKQLDRVIQARIQGYRAAHWEVAHWLIQHTPPSATIALMDIGLIGYVSERRIIDITGLITPEIAHIMHAGGGFISGDWPTARQVAEWVLSQKPEVIILAHTHPDLTRSQGGWTQDLALYTSPTFQAEYEYRFTRRHMEGYYLSVFVRKERSNQ